MLVINDYDFIHKDLDITGVFSEHYGNNTYWKGIGVFIARLI